MRKKEKIRSFKFLKEMFKDVLPEDIIYIISKYTNNYINIKKEKYKKIKLKLPREKRYRYFKYKINNY